MEGRGREWRKVGRGGCWLTSFTVLSAKAFPNYIIDRGPVTSTVNNRHLLEKIRGFQPFRVTSPLVIGVALLVGEAPPAK